MIYRRKIRSGLEIILLQKNRQNCTLWKCDQSIICIKSYIIFVYMCIPCGWTHFLLHSKSTSVIKLSLDKIRLFLLSPNVIAFSTFMINFPRILLQHEVVKLDNHLQSELLWSCRDESNEMSYVVSINGCHALGKSCRNEQVTLINFPNFLLP